MKHILSIGTLLIALTALTLTLILFKGEKQVYYVDNGKLYDAFDLKIEYEKQLQTLRMNRKNKVDSMELHVQQLRAQNKKEEADYEAQYLSEKAGQFDEDEAALMSEYNTQIWKRLNQYALDFGKEKNIDMLFGTNGSGNILFAPDKYDITKDLIAYANNRYHGKK